MNKNTISSPPATPSSTSFTAFLDFVFIMPQSCQNPVTKSQIFSNHWKNCPAALEFAKLTLIV